LYQLVLPFSVFSISVRTTPYQMLWVSTVAGVLGMIPEGLVLLTSVSFILGVGRLARKKSTGAGNGSN